MWESPWGVVPPTPLLLGVFDGHAGDSIRPDADFEDLAPQLLGGDIVYKNRSVEAMWSRATFGSLKC